VFNTFPSFNRFDYLSALTIVIFKKWFDAYPDIINVSSGCILFILNVLTKEKFKNDWIF